MMNQDKELDKAKTQPRNTDDEPQKTGDEPGELSEDGMESIAGGVIAQRYGARPADSNS